MLQDYDAYQDTSLQLMIRPVLNQIMWFQQQLLQQSINKQQMLVKQCLTVFQNCNNRFLSQLKLSRSEDLRAYKQAALQVYRLYLKV